MALLRCVDDCNIHELLVIGRPRVVLLKRNSNITIAIAKSVLQSLHLILCIVSPIYGINSCCVLSSSPRRQQLSCEGVSATLNNHFVS